MKTLAVFALVCATTALARAAAFPAPEEDQIAERHLVKRAASCPSGWSKYSGRCLYYNPRPMSWSKAEKNCKSMGGNLASVHNTDEYQQIQNLILKASHQSGVAWIGGSDAHEVNSWAWTDGTAFSYTDWCDGEPNNGGRQRCLQVNYTGEKCWDNDFCAHKLPSVCSQK